MLTRFTTAIFMVSFLIMCFSKVSLAQVGPQINSPVNNATVNPGDKVPIQFSYQNMGAGACSVNIALWQDASATEKIQDVVTDYEVGAGNSSGVQIDFTKNATYDWYVPHGMNFTFYLTVTETTSTEIGNFSLQSFPLMLHPSSSWAVLPNFAFALVLALGVLFVQA
ncbi:unnamed protein product [Absidia cylindrospora]